MARDVSRNRGNLMRTAQQFGQDPRTDLSRRTNESDLHASRQDVEKLKTQTFPPSSMLLNSGG